MCEEWLPPRWAGTDKPKRRKHSPDTSKSWDEIVAWTGQGRRKWAKYHRDLTDGQIRDIEMNYREGTFLRRRQAECLYYRTFDYDIGASLGQVTRIVLIQQHKSGVVHGRPITQNELVAQRRKAGLE